MPYWSSTYFMNANAPIMEQMLMFHDYSMTIITSIMMFLLIVIMLTTKNVNLNYNLMENQNLEMVWTLIPMIMLMIIAAPSIRILYLMEEIFSPALTIKTMGHQWYWSYEYTDFNMSYDSFMLNHDSKEMFRLMETDESLNIPVNSAVRMMVSSSDVIHSWTIQSLGVKTDAIPGRLNMLNFIPSRPGLLFGQCSEICGSNHSFMPIKINICNLLNFKMKMNNNI